MTEPTVGELVRRLDDAVKAIEKLAENLEKGYVRRELYDESRRGDDRRFKEIEGDVKSQVDFRRQAIVTFAVSGIGWLLTAAIAITNFTSR